MGVKHVHDCFAGPAVKLGALCTRLGITFTGTELERGFLVDPRVTHGDATDITTYPAEPYTIVTSPAYGNGVSDGFMPRDTSTRNTYTSWIARLEGTLRRLHPNNQGQWGYRGRGAKSKARDEYWRVAREVVANWASTPCERVLLNVKDWSAGGVIEPFTDEWTSLLEKFGFAVVRRHVVETKGLPSGRNHKIRVEQDVVIEAVPADRIGEASFDGAGWLWSPWEGGMLEGDVSVVLSGKTELRPQSWSGWSNRPWVTRLFSDN